MKQYEYKSLKISRRFSGQNDLDLMDRTINESAGNGWELVTTTAVANGFWNSVGKTSAVLLTFRRPVP